MYEKIFTFYFNVNNKQLNLSSKLWLLSERFDLFGYLKTKSVCNHYKCSVIYALVESHNPRQTIIIKW